jgi:hypothetical protein
MIDGIEPFYQRIAESMAAALPEEWSAAKFEAIFYPDCSVYEAEYVRQTDGVARSFEPTNDGPRAFRELRSLFQQAGQQVWGRATFELAPDGTFNMRWGYDDCDTNGHCPFDEDEELRRREERHCRLTASPSQGTVRRQRQQPRRSSGDS